MRIKRKRRKKKFIALFFVGVVIVVALAVLYQSPRETPRLTAEEYFDISDVTYEGFIEGNGSLLILHALTFNLTAVAGDAHQVRIPNLALDEPSVWREEYVDLGTILYGEVETVSLSTEQGVYIHLKEEGFPIRVRIISKEISVHPIDQYITYYVPQEEQVSE
ncbi:MAG: hypothetical protein ACFFCW_31155 [Candidatus Hodarchaeota archaeon]